MHRNETDASNLSKKLVVAYGSLPTKVDPIIGAFIPSDAKFSDLEMFRRLVRRQNQYLDHHCKIPINGLDKLILCYVLDNGNDLADEIQMKAQIFCIDPSATKDHIGRYNLSTTGNYYQTAIEWLDIELPKIIATIPEDQRGAFDDCIKRVSPRPQSSKSGSSKHSSNDSVKSNLSVLTSFYGAEGSDDDIPPQVVRHQRPAPHLCFDFDADLDFPNLPAPTQKPVTTHQNASPNQSMKSASSSITMSEIQMLN
jgi:hypothetical protein